VRADEQAALHRSTPQSSHSPLKESCSAFLHSPSSTLWPLHPPRGAILTRLPLRLRCLPVPAAVAAITSIADSSSERRTRHAERFAASAPHRRPRPRSKPSPPSAQPPAPRRHHPDNPATAIINRLASPSAQSSCPRHPRRLPLRRQARTDCQPTDPNELLQDLYDFFTPRPSSRKSAPHPHRSRPRHRPRRCEADQAGGPELMLNALRPCPRRGSSSPPAATATPAPDPVTDTGKASPRRPRQDLPLLFHQAGGTGLGLAMAHRIVQNTLAKSPSRKTQQAPISFLRLPLAVTPGFTQFKGPRSIVPSNSALGALTYQIEEYGDSSGAWRGNRWFSTRKGRVTRATI
jgi:hypothetical protein